MKSLFCKRGLHEYLSDCWLVLSGNPSFFKHPSLPCVSAKNKIKQEVPEKNPWIGTYDFWAGTPCPPPPPKLPFRCPHQDKKGTNLLLFQIGIHLHIHQDLRLKCCRVMGQQLRYGCPCTCDLPGTHNWLAQSHIASISSEFHQRGSSEALKRGTFEM